MSCSNAIKQLIEKTISENKFSALKFPKKITVEIEKSENDNELILKFYIELNDVNSIGKKFIISKSHINSTYETIDYPKYERILNFKLNIDDMSDYEHEKLISEMKKILESSCSISHNKSLSEYLLDLIYMYRKEIY